MGEVPRSAPQAIIHTPTDACICAFTVHSSTIVVQSQGWDWITGASKGSVKRELKGNREREPKRTGESQMGKEG